MPSGATRHRATVALAVLALSAVRCQTATVLRISPRSEVDCSKRARVAVVVSASTRGLLDAVPSAFSTTCNPTGQGDNDTGSVVITPAGSNKDDVVAFAVMTRPDGESPETCLDPLQAKQCIVARRQLRFAPHEEIDIPIELRLSCLGVTCPFAQTCRKGECVDATFSAKCIGTCTEDALAAQSAPVCGDMRGLQPGAPWPMAGYCPTRTGRSGRLGPQSANVRWRFKTGSIATMSPAVAADGTIYVGSNDHNVYAVDPRGNELWRASLASNINDTGFVIGNDGSIAVGCADGNVYAFTPDGKRKWVTPVGSDVAFTPVAGGDGTVYVSGRDDLGPPPVFALGTDGTTRWQSRGRFGVSAITLGLDGTLYLGGGDMMLHALRASDGSALWASPTDTVPRTPSVGGDGTVYVTDAANLYAFAPGGARKWAVPVEGGASEVALGREDRVYVAARSGKLHAIDASGKVAWTYDSGTSWARAPSIGGDGTAYVGADDGMLYAVSSEGALLWKVPTGGGINSQPAIGADGTLYVVSSDSFLYAIGP